jgi:hypothetical protein
MRHSPTFQFAKHYMEMVLVMLLGMGILGGLLLLAAAALGPSPSELQDDYPGLFLAGMGISMAAPMVWWMPLRGHSWPATWAMALAMILPTVATLVFLATGLIEDLHALLMIEHIAMFPAMLVAMLPFRAEFTHGDATVSGRRSVAG